MAKATILTYILIYKHMHLVRRWKKRHGVYNMRELWHRSVSKFSPTLEHDLQKLLDDVRHWNKIHCVLNDSRSYVHEL